MRLSSEEFKNQNSGNLLKLDISWVDDAHAPITLTYDDISAFSYQADGTQTSYMGFGLASICTFSISLINTSGKWDRTAFKGAKAILSIGKRLSTGDEYIKLGHFTIENGKKSEGVINITAEDNMALFDVRFKGITFPCTVKDLVTQACEQVGIRLATYSHPNFNKIVDTLENVTQFTCREILSLACELLGAFAIINSDGDLEIKWFNTNRVDVTIPQQFITACKPEEARRPTGISAYFSGEEFLVGSNEAPLFLTEDHVLVRNITGPDKEAILEEIYNNSIVNLRYDVGTLTSKGICLLEPGDVVQFEHKSRIYKFIVASIKLSGNLSMTITSTAPSSSSSTSGRGSTSSGGKGESSSLQIAHMLSYDNASLSPAPTIESAVELISVFITQSGNHVPVAMFTTTFDYSAPDDTVAKVRISLLTGQFIVHSFDQNCHIGSNMISFTWPLADLPQGASKISVTASVNNTSSHVPQFSWKSGDTSLVVLGRGFSTVSTWNGLLILSDTFKEIPYISTMKPSYELTQMTDEVRSKFVPYSSNPFETRFAQLELNSHNTHRDTILLRGFSERISTNLN